MHGIVSLKLKAKERLCKVLNHRSASIIANAKTPIVSAGSWIKTFSDIMPV